MAYWWLEGVELFSTSEWGEMMSKRPSTGKVRAGKFRTTRFSINCQKS
jgi:hypothetical protein